MVPGVIIRPVYGQNTSVTVGPAKATQITPLRLEYWQCRRRVVIRVLLLDFCAVLADKLGKVCIGKLLQWLFAMKTEFDGWRARLAFHGGEGRKRVHGLLRRGQLWKIRTGLKVVFNKNNIIWRRGGVGGPSIVGLKRTGNAVVYLWKRSELLIVEQVQGTAVADSIRLEWTLSFLSEVARALTLEVLVGVIWNASGGSGVWCTRARERFSVCIVGLMLLLFLHTGKCWL